MNSKIREATDLPLPFLLSPALEFLIACKHRKHAKTAHKAQKFKSLIDLLSALPILGSSSSSSSSSSSAFSLLLLCFPSSSSLFSPFSSRRRGCLKMTCGHKQQPNTNANTKTQSIFLGSVRVSGLFESRSVLRFGLLWFRWQVGCSRLGSCCGGCGCFCVVDLGVWCAGLPSVDGSWTRVVSEEEGS